MTFVPIGLSYAGTASIPTSPTNPGATNGAAFINQDGDYESDGAGDVVKTTHTAQRALLLLRTSLASAGVNKNLGLSVPIAVDRTWNNKMRSAVEKALKPMTDDASIRIDKIDIEKTLANRCSICVTYTVIASGQTEIARI